MAIRPIVTRGHPVLTRKTTRVPRIDASLHMLLDDMVETMDNAPGVGLAANQIGVQLRIMVMRVENIVYEVINPEIVKLSGEVEHSEACLSLPGWIGETRRAERVTVKGLDRQGREIRIKGEGLLAQCIQHEVDHLEGRLYVDRLTSMDTFREAGADDLDEMRESRAEV